MRHTISLCMIVKNEEKLLSRCLDSVQGIVDEIIIVDTGSEDSTVEIAKRYGTKVYHFHWIDDFAAARNYSIKFASCDYILWLDADEYLESNSILQEEIRSGKDYYFTRIRNHLSNGSAVIHDNFRLFKNNIGLHFKNRLHEHLNIDEISNLSSDRINTIIEHTGYMDQLMNEKDKHQRNLTIMEKEARENPTGYSLFNLGKVYYDLGKYEEAIKVFQKSYPLSKSKSYITSLISFIALTLNKLDKKREAISILRDALDIYVDHTDFYYQLANLYKTIWYYKDAEWYLHKCLQLGDSTYNEVLSGVGSYLSEYNLGLIYKEQGDKEKAFYYLKKALRSNNKLILALEEYIKLMQQVNLPIEEVSKHITDLYPNPEFIDIKNIVGRLYKLRNPLLIVYIEKLNIKVDIDDQAVALQYAKEYQKAKELWLASNTIKKQNAKDILALALIIINENLLIRAKELYNLSDREFKICKKIVYRDELINIKKSNKVIESILIEVIELLIILEEFHLFEYIYQIIIDHTSEDCKINLCELLMDYGFSQVAYDTLNILMKEYPKNMGVKKLMIQLYTDNKMWVEALEILQPLLNEKEYWIYDKFYDICDRLDYNEEKKLAVREIRERFPMSVFFSSLNTL